MARRMGRTVVDGPPADRERFIELTSLALFSVVSRELSLTQAASQMGMTQSAVSQALKQVERTLGVELLDRSRRPLRLTAAGMQFQSYADAMLREARQMPALVRRSAQIASPVVRLGLVDSFASVFGPHLVHHLQNRADRLTIRSGINSTIEEAFSNRELDLIVTTQSLDSEDGLERHELFQDPLVLVAPPGYVDRSIDSLRELSAKVPLVRYGRRSSLGVQIDVHLRRLGIEPPNRFEIDSTDTLLRMVSAGPGWAVTTAICLLQAEHSIGAANVLTLPGPSVSRGMTLVARRGEQSEMPQQLAKICRNVLGRDLLPRLRELLPWIRKDVFRI